MKRILVALFVTIIATSSNLYAAKPKLLFLAGSARAGSFNKMLAHDAYEIARAAGADATFIDLKDYPMPIYDGDLEEKEGLPTKARELKKIFAEHDGIFIASPEYNYSMTPLFKNAFDWTSCGTEKNERPLSAFQGKTIALSAASPGPSGGKNSIAAVRTMFKHCKIKVLPEQITVAHAYDKFADGHLQDNKLKMELEHVVNDLIKKTKHCK